MPQEVIEFLKGFNLQTLISMFVMLHFMLKGIKEQLQTMNSDMKDMNKEFHNMNTRVSHIEGTVYGKDIYKQEAK